MAFNVIHTDPVSLNYDEIVQLNGIEYVLNFFWSGREGAWYLSLYDQNNDPIALWIRLVVSWPLLARFTDSRLPPGVLFCVDLTGANQDIIAAGDLGTRVELVYDDGLTP